MTRTSSPINTPVPACPGPLLSPTRQIVLSVLLAVHLCAVFVAPFSFAAGGSPAAATLSFVLQPYTNLLYLNHGYFFFAPDPGPNHLVRYELEFSDGRPAEVGQFPDRNEQGPRLLYHRHFMLAESLNNYYEPPTPAPEPRQSSDDSRAARRAYQRQKAAWDEAYKLWRQRRNVYEALRTSIAAHLQHETGASNVTLIRREHRPLSPIEFSQDRFDLNEAATFRDLPEVSNMEVLPWNPTSPR